jgi:transketolase
LARGAYTLSGHELKKPDLLILASGSEVHLALGAATELKKKGVKARVVNFPSWELFEEQPKPYKEEVLPPSVPLRLGVEAAVAQGWERYLGPQGQMISIERFGASAPYKVLAEKFGFTISNIVSEAEVILSTSHAR